jgi:hypothetical protein
MHRARIQGLISYRFSNRASQGLMAPEQIHCSEPADENAPARDTEVTYCYRNGSGISMNIDKAKATFQNVAAHGVREAPVVLARLNKPHETP